MVVWMQGQYGAVAVAVVVVEGMMRNESTVGWDERVLEVAVDGGQKAECVHDEWHRWRVLVYTKAQREQGRCYWTEQTLQKEVLQQQQKAKEVSAQSQQTKRHRSQDQVFESFDDQAMAEQMRMPL